MTDRKNLDISAYLVIGPENVVHSSFDDVIYSAACAGFTCIQVRSKTASAKTLLAYIDRAAKAISDAGKSDSTVLIVNDRVDVALWARDIGIALDGVHVGQSDISPSVCRKILGDQAIIGLTAPENNLLKFVRETNLDDVDYLGVAPLHASTTKTECGKLASGEYVTISTDELRKLHNLISIPVVVGGGVQRSDLYSLKQTGVEGFFVVSAVCGSKNPLQAAKDLVLEWTT